MSIHRRAAKRDASEPGIVDALQAVGAHVERLSLPVDLLVHFRGHWHLLEVKTPGVRPDKRQLAQHRFCAEFSVPIITTPAEALRAIGAAT